MSNAILEVTVAWGPTILDVHHLALGERFVLGEGSPYGGIDGLVAPGASITLAQVEADGPRIWLPAGVSATYQAGEHLTPLPAEQSRTLVLGREARLKAEAGALTLYFQRVEAAQHPGRGSLWGIFGDLRGMAGAAILHALFLVVAITLPPDQESLSLDALDQDDRFINVSFKPTESREKDPFALEATPTDKGGGEDKTAPAPAQPSGSIAEPRLPVRPGGGSGETRETRVGKAVAAAETLKSVMDEVGGDIFGGADPLGREASSALAGLNGGDNGRGLAMRGGGSPWGGMGPPGGGPRGPVAGLEGGPYRTRPTRPGPKTGLGEREAREPTIKVLPQTPIVDDGLSRDDIQRVVRLKAAEYRFCYEKQLQTRPDLEGKITLKFVVGSNGKVLSAEVLDSTMADPEVASCIATKASRWQFPSPRGGGMVVVRYPFLFRRS